jgi:hypothetical protein
MINWPVKFVESKYSKYYEQLIARAQSRGNLQGYKETHHVIPRSFGGENIKSNYVQLTAREHYVAHALLWKMKFEGIYGSKMAFAFNTFINRMQTKEREVNHTYKINSRTYASFRKHYSDMLKEKYAREGGTWVGRKHTEESKRKIGEKSKLKEFKKGPENPNWGKKLKMTEDGTKRKKDAQKARWADPAFKQMMIDKRMAFFETPEGIAQRKATSDRTKGIKRDPAIMEKMAVTKRGKTWEELYTTEQIARMHEARKNRVLSEEAKAKMWFKGKGKGISKVKHPCPHCGKMCAGNMLAKWHGDNCKTLKNI